MANYLNSRFGIFSLHMDVEVGTDFFFFFFWESIMYNVKDRVGTTLMATLLCHGEKHRKQVFGASL